jgi:glycosyltransferase involved in cell wall biosynthesis
MEQRLFSGADHCIVTTADMRDVLVKDYGVSQDKICVIGNFVETDIFRPLMPPAERERRLVFLGRLDPQKNLPTLIHAVAREGIGLSIIGEGAERSALHTLAGELGADVRFMGNRPHRELPALLGNHQAFVLPSNYEGHPKALLEAMACGLPVVGSDVPGIKGVIRHEETGLLASPTVEGLAASIRRLWDEPTLRIRLGDAARAEILATLSVDRAVEQESKLIRDLARQAKSPMRTGIMS